MPRRARQRAGPRLVVKTFRLPEGMIEELHRFYPSLKSSKLLRILLEQHLQKLRILENRQTIRADLVEAAESQVNEVVAQLSSVPEEEEE